MIKIAVVIGNVDGKPKGGVHLDNSAETDKQLLILGKALQSAMSLTLQCYQSHYLRGEQIEPDSFLKQIAADISDKLELES